MRTSDYHRFGRLTEIKPCTEGLCSVDAVPILQHGPTKSATHAALKPNGAPVRLCAYCASYVLAYQWAARLGHKVECQQQLAALGWIWRADTGFVVPRLGAWRLSARSLAGVVFALGQLAKLGLVQKISGRYLLRDACPACFRRGGCDRECGLHFDPELFAAQKRNGAQSFDGAPCH